MAVMLAPGSQRPLKADNRRKSPRWCMCRTAEVFCGTGREPITCRIVDLSEGGARLVIPARLAAALPRTFTLALFRDGSVNRDCKVVWTNKWNLGVKFTSGWYSALDMSTAPRRQPKQRRIAHLAGAAMRGRSPVARPAT
jgi:PilZ domain